MRQQIILLTLISILTVLVMGSVSAAPLSGGNLIYVSPTGNDTNNGLTASTAVQTISTGISLVNDGGQVRLASGIYNKTSVNGNDVNIDINKNVIIAGAGQDKTIIDAQNNSQIFRIGYGYTVLIKDITFINGILPNSGGAIANDGTLTIINCTFENNTADNEVGGALFTHTNLTVIHCNFYGNIANSGSAIFNKGGFLTVTDSMFSGNIAANEFELYHGGTINNYAGTYQIISNSFISNIGSALHVDSYIPEGGLPTGLPLITTNIIVGNSYGIYIEPLGNQAPEINGHRINATNNWWGSNSDPKDDPTNIVGDVNMVLADPWLIFELSADPKTIKYGGTSQIVGNLNHNNLGQDISSIGHVPDGTLVFLTADIGDIDDAGIKEKIVSTINGVVTATLMADDGVGIANIYAYAIGAISTDPVIAQVEITAAEPVIPVDSNVVSTTTDPATIKSIGMKDTGVPFLGLLLAFLMVIGGFTVQKSKLRF